MTVIFPVYIWYTSESFNINMYVVIQYNHMYVHKYNVIVNAW